MQPLVKITALTKSYGKKIALQVDSLTIREGQLYLLSGPNGSGKSTLLNIIGLLARPDCGEMLVAGEAVKWKAGTLTRLRKQVTLLHQSPYLFRGTVDDNVGFGLALRGVRGADARHAIDEALRIVGLHGFQLRKSDQLSGGEMQRVALARALAIKPKLLLLDEPLANVDQETAAILEKVITALAAEGTTVVMSSHDPHLQTRIPCKVIKMQGGRVEPPDLAENFAGCSRTWKSGPMQPLAQP